jgi:hypothetical protein
MTSLVASENLMNRRHNTYLDAQSSCVSSWRIEGGQVRKQGTLGVLRAIYDRYQNAGWKGKKVILSEF